MNFKLFDIPVKITPMFWLFLVFFSGMYQAITPESLIWAGVAFVGLLVHELGHAFAVLRFGRRPEITLEAFGGNVRYDGRGISAKQRFLITTAGPLFGGALAVLAWSCLKIGFFSGMGEYALYATMWVNGFWTLLNLLPVEPLDGGKIARYLLEKKFAERGTKASVILGLIAVVAATPILIYYGFMFFPIFLAVCGFKNLQEFKQGSGYQGSSNLSSYNEGMEALKKEDLKSAKAILGRLMRSKDKHFHNSALEGMAKVYLKEGKKNKSFDLLMHADHGALRDGKCLLCKLAFEKGNYELVAKYSRDIYDIESSFEIAVLIAKSFARLGKSAHSGAWLETASMFDGIKAEKMQALIEEEDFKKVRELEDFQKYVQKFSPAHT